MTLFNAVATIILVSGVLGLFAIWYMAAWKISAESINSPKFAVRWIYRYLIFSFWFGFSFLLVGPITTWQLVKIPAVDAFSKQHSWTLLLLTAIPTLLLYYLHRKFVIFCDPAKIRAREKLRLQLLSRAGR